MKIKRLYIFAVSDRKSDQSLSQRLIQERVVLAWETFYLLKGFLLLIDFIKDDSFLISDKEVKDVTDAVDPVKNYGLFYLFFYKDKGFDI